MNINNTSHLDNHEVDLHMLLKLIWKGKFFILLSTFLFSLAIIFYSLSIPNLYSSTSLLATAYEKDNLSSKLGSYSVLAGAAGISLPGDSDNPSTEAVARIESLDFFSNHFLPHIKIENLMAIKSWLYEGNIIEYNENIFDYESGKWKNGSKFSKNNIPSNQEAYWTYLKNLSISEDNKTGFISITITHQSPYLAKKWVDVIVKNINESMRNDSNKISTNSINFLKKKTQETNLKEINQAISKLLESQMQKQMLASVSEDYIFKILDRASVPEAKASPRRSLIVILGSLFGFLLSLCIYLANYFFKNTP
tara:strand:- start:417 stop:1343 length:927 start_codon:yes stop_codon:yes gene_type:complete